MIARPCSCCSPCPVCGDDSEDARTLERELRALLAEPRSAIERAVNEHHHCSVDAALQVFGMSHDEFDSLCSRLREEAETP